MIRTLVNLIAFTSLTVHAQALAGANAHFREAEAKLSVASTEVHDASTKFRECRNGRLQLQFSATLEKLEASRKMLEVGRKKTQATRRALEATRVSIEHQHHAMTANQYSTRMETEYVTPFEHEVVAQVQSYAEGERTYALILTQYAAFCAASGSTGPKGAELISSLSPELETLEATAARLSENAPTRVSGR